MKDIISLSALIIVISFMSSQKIFSQTKQSNNKIDSIENKEIIEYYDTGKIKSKWTYKGKVKNGAFQMFHPNGQVWSDGTYVNGLPSGIIKIYDYDGSLVKEEVWENGVCKKQTKIKEWEPDGTIHTEMKNGQSVEYIWKAGKKIEQK